MNVNQNKARYPKLPGLRIVREALGLDVAILAALPGCGSRQNIYRIDRCEQGVSHGTIEAFSSVLGCYPKDLTKSPSEQRILEIKADYLRRAADQAAMAVTAWSPK